MPFTLPGFAAGSMNQMMQISNNFNNLNGIGALSFNSATINAGFVFTARFTQTLTGAVVNHGSNTGTPTGTRLDLFAVDSNGFPTGASLANVVYTATPGAINTVTFGTPFSATAGTSYAMVWSNTTAVPAANFFQILQVNTFTTPGYFRYVKNTDGSTWLQVDYIAAFIHAAPTYGTFGTDAPLVYTGVSGSQGQAIYNTVSTRVGRTAVKINLPHSGLLWAIGVAFQNKAGSPTGYNVAGEVCTATGSVGTTDTVWAAPVLTGTQVKFYFDTPIPLTAGVDYYIGAVAVGTAGTQNSSNNVIVQCNKALLQPATLGPMIDTYSSSNVTPSFTQVANGCAAIDAFVEIVGSSASAGNFANGTIF